MKRREFLQLTCTVAMATIAGTLRAGSWSRRWPACAPASGDALLASVGFAESWETGTLTDARALSGDGRFLSRDARIELHGFSPGPRPMSLTLDALYKIGDDTARFRAAAQDSVPVRFTMPVDPVGGVQFELLARAPQAVTIPLRFAVNSNAGSIPLRRGLYVIALHDRASSPDWRALQVRRDGNSPALAGVALPALLLGFEPAS